MFQVQMKKVRKESKKLAKRKEIALPTMYTAQELHRLESTTTMYEQQGMQYAIQHRYG